MGALEDLEEVFGDFDPVPLDGDCFIPSGNIDFIKVHAGMVRPADDL